MQHSGQINAHIEQPLHSIDSLRSAKGKPFLFNLLLFLSPDLGQKFMHKKQPLHLS